jgi:uncharacterized protein YciI
MKHHLAAAYAPFRATLLAGGFDAPPPGEWPAQLIAAHIARNNDLIAAVAEAVVGGETVSYDNASSVDEAELTRYVEEVGGMAGIIREVERSAARQAEAYDALAALAEVAVNVRIRDGGDIARDGPIPIGAFIEGNASFHLQAHHDQLSALRPAWIGAPPPEFDTYQLVLLTRAANPPDLDEAASSALQRAHLGHFAKMRAAGLMSAAGPIRGDDEIAGICFYTAGDVTEARALAEDDPAVRAGRFEIKAMDWYTAKGAIDRSS